MVAITMACAYQLPSHKALAGLEAQQSFFCLKNKNVDKAPQCVQKELFFVKG